MPVPFSLITPQAVVFDGQADLVIAVGTEGEIGILPQHAPFLTALRPGVTRANVRDGNDLRRLEIATGEGFLQALPGKVTILVDEAYGRDQIDIAQTREDLAQAREAQRAAGGDLAAWRSAQAKIDLAVAKLRVEGVSAGA